MILFFAIAITMETKTEALLTSWNALCAEIPKKYQASINKDKNQKDDFLLQFRGKFSCL